MHIHKYIYMEVQSTAEFLLYELMTRQVSAQLGHIHVLFAVSTDV
jgi:hypothetical protein